MSTARDAPVKLPHSVAELFRRARAAGRDSLGIVDDPEALRALANMQRDEFFRTLSRDDLARWQELEAEVAAAALPGPGTQEDVNMPSKVLTQAEIDDLTPFDPPPALRCPQCDGALVAADNKRRPSCSSAASGPAGCAGRWHATPGPRPIECTNREDEGSRASKTISRRRSHAWVLVRFSTAMRPHVLLGAEIHIQVRDRNASWTRHRRRRDAGAVFCPGSGRRRFEVMGQYHVLFNLDKRQFVHPHRIGNGGKLMEQVGFSVSTSSALFLLLAASCKGDERRGGGDCQPHQLVGSWAGDRIAIIGDYADSTDVPGINAVMVRAEARDPGNGWTDISATVRAMLEAEFGGEPG